MAIGNFVSEMLAEGIIFRWLTKIWTAFKSGMSNPMVQEFFQKKLIPKGLDDESIFSGILAKADMRGKKKQFVKVLNIMEKDDRLNGSKYIRNFRLIVAIDAVGRNMFIRREKLDANGKVVSVKYSPNPGYVHSGQTILESLAEECNTDAEMIQYIMATGMMQDAPFGTLDELKHWFFSTGWPWFQQQYDTIFKKMADTAADLEDYYLQRDLNMDAFVHNFQSLSWQGKIKRVLNPMFWIRMITF